MAAWNRLCEHRWHPSGARARPWGHVGGVSRCQRVCGQGTVPERGTRQQQDSTCWAALPGRGRAGTDSWTSVRSQAPGRGAGRMQGTDTVGSRSRSRFPARGQAPLAPRPPRPAEEPPLFYMNRRIGPAVPGRRPPPWAQRSRRRSGLSPQVTAGVGGVGGTQTRIITTRSNGLALFLSESCAVSRAQVVVETQSGRQSSTFFGTWRNLEKKQRPAMKV